MRRIPSSFGARLVITVLATATVAITALVGLTFYRLESGLERQAEQLGRLSAAKLARRLGSEDRLAQARLEILFSDVQKQLAHIAQRADVVRAIDSRNVVAVSEVLGRAAETADIDGVLVVDPGIDVIGMAANKLGLLATREALRGSKIPALIKSVTTDNDPIERRRMRRIVALDKPLAEAVGAKRPAPLAGVFIEPVFDEFGDVFAALVAHRALRPQEGVLAQLSKLEGAGLLVLADDKVISSAGVEAPVPAKLQAQHGRMFATEDGRHWARCANLYGNWQMCALALKSELHALRDEMVRVGEQETRALAKWLFLVAALSLVACGLATFWAARHVTGPMAKITEAVRAVARGDWKSEVVGIARRDEIGAIARAVVKLQRSMEERDRLRCDAAEAQSIDQRRGALESAIKNFDRSMRSTLLSVTDSIEFMEETSRELARISTAAEGEADEAAFVQEGATESASAVRSAVDELTESVSEIIPALTAITSAIAANKQTANGAACDFAKLAAESKEVHALVRVAERSLHEAGLLALDGGSVPDGQRRAENAGRDLTELAGRISSANEGLHVKAYSIEGTSTEAVETMRTIARNLEDVLERAESAVSTLAAHDISARAISKGVANAATGGTNVSASVERLKDRVAETQSISKKIFSKATELGDDSRRLDTAVKTFLREISETQAPEQNTAAAPGPARDEAA